MVQGTEKCRDEDEANEPKYEAENGLEKIPRYRVQHTDRGKPTEKSDGSHPAHRRLSREAKLNFVRQLEPWSSIASTRFLWMEPRTLWC